MAYNNRKKHHHYNPPAVEVDGDKEVLALSVEDLGLPEDTLALLLNNKINTIYDLARRTERDMFRVQTFNKKHLTAVKKAINAKGIDFMPFVPKPTADTAEKPQSPQQAQVKQPQQQPPRNDKQRVDNRQQNKQQQGKQQQQSQTKQPQNQQPKFEKKPKVELPVEEWVKVSKNGKWGFSNGLTTVIYPKFDEVFCFKDGVACVDVDGKFGYIDTKGEFIIEPTYECAMSFSEGMAVVFEGEKVGYINKSNEKVIECKYEAATAFENGRAKVKLDGKWNTIDAEGNTLWSK